MKHLKKSFLLLAMLIVGFYASAHDFEVDGIYYNILSADSLTCEVTFGTNKYSGSVVIPEMVSNQGKSFEVIKIREDAFSFCYSLTSVTIPDSVTEIGDWSFNDCSGLTSVSIGKGVTKIGEYAFYECSGLTSVSIGKGVTTIGKYAFSCCRGLLSVTIGGNVESLGNGAFRVCTSLKKISIEEGPKEFVSYVNGTKGSFSDCPLEYVYLGRNSRCEVENNGNIENYGSPFFGIKSIKELIIGDSVTIIGDRAFYECVGLTSVTIGKNVTKIEDNAFYYCDNLNDVYSLNPFPPRIRRWTFSNYENAILYVPKGSLTDYKEISYWKYFCRILEKDFGGVEAVDRDEVKVFANGTRISVVGADENVLVEVFNLNGQLVCRGYGNDFEVGKSGIYIVRIAGKAFKVAVK